MQNKKRYYIQNYGRWLYIIIDSETNLAVRKPGKEHITYSAYDENGKCVFLTFNSLKEAENKLDLLNKE